MEWRLASKPHLHIEPCSLMAETLKVSEYLTAWIRLQPVTAGRAPTPELDVGASGAGAGS